MIFKKELEEEFQILNNHFLRKQQQIQCEMEKNKKKYGIVERIFYLFRNAEIIGMEKNKKDDELFIVMNNDTIYLLGERYQGITNLPRILFHVYKTDDEFFQKKYIHIDDVLMEDNDVGNGTIAMKALIKYAKRNNIKWIEGSLSSVDNDHADRRNHYYEKFGFKIQSSSIRLDITA